MMHISKELTATGKLNIWRNPVNLTTGCLKFMGMSKEERKTGTDEIIREMPFLEMFVFCISNWRWNMHWLLGVYFYML